MNLNDLFEAPIPPHIKPSDIPPTMRNRPLTMRDVEAERPQSVYRFRVGDKNFMDLGAAQDFAAGTGQKVERIAEEQLDEQDIDISASMNPVNRGGMIITALEKDKEFARMSRRPIRFKMAGEQFVITDPEVKKSLYNEYLKKKNNPSALTNFLMNLGQPDSLHYLLNQLGGPSDVGVGGQGATPRAPRYARESQDTKKKDKINERDGATALSPRAQRIMQQVRLRQPQATGDMDALAFDYERQQQKDRSDIARLDKEQDDLAADIRRDLEKSVEKLRGRKGVSSTALDRIERSDQAQNDAIQRISQLDQEQQKAIDDLEKAMAASTRPAAYSSKPTVSQPAAAAVAAPVAEPQAEPQPAAEPASTPVQVKAEPVKVAKKVAKKPKAKKLQTKKDTAKKPAAPIEPKQTAKVLKFPGLRRGQTGTLPGIDSEPEFDLATGTGGRLGESGIPVKRDENENIILDEAGKDACYNKVRSRYKVWPSAYASGALVQCRKKGAANWGNKSK